MKLTIFYRDLKNGRRKQKTILVTNKQVAISGIHGIVYAWQVDDTNYRPKKARFSGKLPQQIVVPTENYRLRIEARL